MAAILFLCSLSSGVLAQDEMVYKNPELGIQFTASSTWTQVPHLEDGQGYEYVNQNNNMQVKMWYSTTDAPVLDYLRSEVCKEGRITGEGPFSLIIDDQQAYGICSLCSEMRKPFQVMLIALPSDHGIYLIRFKCPEECYTEHTKQIEEFLGSISMGMVVERSVFYAENI